MRACPVCESSGEMKVLSTVCLSTENHRDLVECPQCESSFFGTMPSTQELKAFYHGSYFNAVSVKDQERGTQFARYLLSRHRRGRILDLGCHRGDFLYGIKEHSEWDLVGTEFSESSAAYIKKTRGVEVKSGELYDIQFTAESFDVIHIQDILEHLREPVATLLECRRILKPGGVIFLAVPNGSTERLDMINFHHIHQRPSLSPDGHLFFFSRVGLESMARLAGFRVSNVRSLDFKNGLRQLGWLPRKRNWQDRYDPKLIRPRVAEDVGRLAGVMPQAPGLLRMLRREFRFLRDAGRRRRGWYQAALNFELTLEPLG